MTDPDAQPLEGDLDEFSWLRRLARRLVADAHGADDAVQETWLAARGKAPRDRRGFLATLMLNRLRQAARSQGRRGEREEEVVRGRRLAEPSASDTAQRIERSRLLLDALEGLEEPYRTVVTLRYLDELAPRRIAARLGVPVKTVHTRLERGLAKMRARLDQRFEGDRDAWLRALAPFGWTLGDALVATLAGAAMTTKLIVGVASVAVAAVALLVAPDFFAEEREPRATQPLELEQAPVVAPPTPPERDELRASNGRAEVEARGPRPAAEQAPRAARTGRATLEVRVRRSGTGEPLAGITVSAFRADAGRLSQDALGQRTTDADGALVLALPSGMPLQLLARPGSSERDIREGGRLVEALADGAREHVVLELDRGTGARFYAEVLDDRSGALLPGALVVDDDPRALLDDADAYDVMRSGEFGSGRALVTDELGRFELDYAPWAPREAWVAAPGYWPQQVDVGRHDQGPGRPHTVRLRRSAVVLVQVEGDDDTWISLAGPGVPARTGRWVGPSTPIHVQVPAEVELVGELWNRERGVLWKTPVPLVLEQGERRELVWVPRLGVRVFGQVVDGRGAPVTGEPVVVWAAEVSDLARYERGLLTEESGAPAAVARTDGEGRFLFDDLPFGAWWIALRPGDEDSELAPVGAGVTLAEGELEREVRIETARGWYLAGVAQGPDGEPFRQGTLSASPVGLFGRATANLDGDGCFQLGPVVPGKYRLWLYGPGYMSSGRVTVEAGSAIKLLLGDVGAISGTVRDPDGRTFKAHVQLITSRGSLGMGVSGQAMGTFLFAELDPGTYTVKATTEDGRVAVQGGLELRRDKAYHDLELTLRPGGKIRVELDGPPGFRCALFQGDVRLEDSSIGGTVFALAPEGDIRVEVYGKNTAGEEVRESQHVQSIPGRVQEVHFTVER